MSEQQHTPGMVEVTKEEFFATVGTMNVHPHPRPMDELWKLPDGRILGRSTPGYLCRDEEGRWTTTHRYWAAKSQPTTPEEPR